MAAVRFPGNRRDSLLLSFEEEAKVSIVDFDQAKLDLKTVSLHYFEDDLLKEGRSQFVRPSTIRIDEQQRCAGLLIFDSKFVVIPFKEGSIEAFAAAEAALASSSASKQGAQGSIAEEQKKEIPVKRHLLIDLRAMGLLNIKDYAFLSGYSYQPTLLVLHENEPTWSGRLEVRRNTCTVTAISIDLQGGDYHPVIWSVSSLPHDCYRLVPLRENVAGGALVVAHDSIWHVNQRATAGLSLNDICKPGDEFGYPVQPEAPPQLNIRLDSATHVHLREDRVLFSLRRGELYLLQLHAAGGGRGMQRMMMSKITTSVLASCMCTIGDHLLFIGSRLGDSLLVDYREKTTAAAAPRAATVSSSTTSSDQPAAKKQRLENGSAVATSSGLDSADDFLSALDSDMDALPSTDASNTTGQVTPADDAAAVADSRGAGATYDLDLMRDESDDEEEDDDDYDEIFADAGTASTSARHSFAATSAAYDASQVTYELRLRETLVNIGPIASMTQGEDVGSVSKYLPRTNKMQLATCSGYGKNGAICVLQRTIKPEQVHEDKLPFALQQMWTLHLALEKAAKSAENGGSDGDESDDAEDSDEEVEVKTYLLLASEKDKKLETRILEAEDELDEVDREGVGIVRDDTTLAAGTLRNNTRGIQVTTTKVALFDADLRLLEEMDLSQIGKKVHAASILDPFVLLHFTDGTLLLLEYTGMVNKDTGSVFSSKRKFAHITAGLGKITAVTLYAPAAGAGYVAKKMGELRQHLAVVCWSSGAMEIYTVPDFKSVYVYLEFDALHEIVHDMNPSKEQLRSFVPRENATVFVKELMLRSVGGRHEDPHLFAVLNDDSVHVYRSYSFISQAQKTAAAAQQAASGSKAERERLTDIRFKKVDIGLFQRRISEQDTQISHEIDYKLDLSPGAKEMFVVRGSSVSYFRTLLVPFGNIANMSGVFVCGRNPAWFLSDRGRVIAHPMPFDAPIPAFAPFANIGNGFVYYSQKAGKFKVCQLHESSPQDHRQYYYTTPWPMHKVLLKQTPHHIVYHESTQTYLVACSTTVVSELPEEVQYPPDENGRYPLLTEEKYELRLYDSRWKLLETIVLDPQEQVLSMASVMISKEDMEDEDDDYIVDIKPEKDESQLRKPKTCSNVLVVGTGFDEGEDEQSRGKIYIYDFDATIGADNKSTVKLKQLQVKEMKGVVTALANLDGYLIAAVGTKLYVWWFDWDASQLIASSFFDTQFYTISLSVFKRYIVYGDMYRSVHFLRWKEKGHKLIELSKDPRFVKSYRSDFMIDGQNLEVVAMDDCKNIQIFTYAPRSLETFLGKKLLSVADFHSGLSLHSTMRMKMRPVAQQGLQQLHLLQAQQSQQQGQGQQQQAVFMLFATLEGALGYVAPIDEITYRRLNLLQTKMYTQLQHPCGLHPKRYRLYAPPGSQFPQNNSKNFIDGRLVEHYLSLDLDTQRTLAQQIGTVAERIFLNLSQLQEATYYF